MNKNKLLAVSFDAIPESLDNALHADINVHNIGRKSRAAACSDDLSYALNELFVKGLSGNILDKFQVAFLFTGQGSQYFGMCKDLYDKSVLFNKHINDAAYHVNKHLDVNILDVIYTNDNNELINQTGYTQPALFVIEYALAMTWMNVGVKPDLLMGHSVGEFAAAVIAGIMSLPAGAELISMRAKLMQDLPGGGAMAAIMANKQVVTSYVDQLKSKFEHIDIAAVNGPKQVVVSGSEDAVLACIDLALVDKVKARQLVVSHAFHSSLMSPMLNEFAKVAIKHDFHAPKTKLVSNLTGSFMQDAPSSSYWVDHVRLPVLFSQGVDCCVSDLPTIFIEVGPEAVLSGMASRCVAGQDNLYWLSSASRKKPAGYNYFLDNIKKAFSLGVSLNTVAVL